MEAVAGQHLALSAIVPASEVHRWVLAEARTIDQRSGQREKARSAR